MSRRIVLMLIFLLPFLFTAQAQAQTARKGDSVISGTVYGADGKSVPAAAVTCQSSAGIKPRVVHTNAKGHFLITGLKQDNYDLRATSNGAYSDWEKNILVRKGQNKEVDLRLLNGNTALSGLMPAKKSK